MSGAFLTRLATACEQSQAPQHDAAGTMRTETAYRGKWICLFAKQHENARKKTQPASRCDDPETQTTEKAETKTEGIEGILEGFGLLSFKMEGVGLGEYGEQTMMDVKNGQPSVENDIARKQMDAPQTVLRANQNIETLDNDQAANMPQSQGASNAPAQQDAANAAQPVEQSAANVPETADGRRVDATLFKGVANAVTDLYESTQSPDAGHGNAHTADVSPAMGQAYDLTDAKRQSGSEYRGAQAEEQEQAAIRQEGQQNRTAVFIPDAATGITGAGTAIKATANDESLQQPSTAHVGEADMTRNVMRIVKNITAQVKGNDSELSVTLRPEFLGKLSIKLVMGEDGIKAQLKTQSEAVKAVMGEQIAALHETLKEKGIPVSQIEVAYEAPAFNGQQPHDGSGQQWTSRPNTVWRGFSSNDTAQPVNMETMVESDLAIKNSSVEFKA